MRLLAALTLALLLAGCSTDREDQAFFEQGWIKPEQGANRRMYGTRTPVAPVAPEKPVEPSAR